MTEPELMVRYTESDRAQRLRSDVSEGLQASPKWLPSKWFYDAKGSELFERITSLPEYYQTRAEHSILREHAVRIAEITGVETLIELGSGSSEKTRLLLDAMRDTGTLKRFVPVDVSESALRTAVWSIAAEYPDLAVCGVVDDFVAGPRIPQNGVRMVVFLGGTIGNLLPKERVSFLSSVRSALNPGEWLLLGTDLVKDPRRLVRAYDDHECVTAAFNRNLLWVVNRELGADFTPEKFTHIACWDQRQEWIEMRLRARRAMRVTIPDVDLTLDFAEAEEIRTEVSAKFRPERVRAELDTAGFDLLHWWTDAPGDFALSLSRVAAEESRAPGVPTGLPAHR